MDKRIGARLEGLVFLAAVWLLLAPLVLDFLDLGGPAIFAAWGSAILLYLSVSEATVFPGVVDEWLDAIVATGLIASPWLLGYDGNEAAMYNAVATGLVVLAGVSFELAHALAHSGVRTIARSRRPPPPRGFPTSSRAPRRSRDTSSARPGKAPRSAFDAGTAPTAAPRATTHIRRH